LDQLLDEFEGKLIFFVRQPMQRRHLLARCHLHKLRGFALQLDVIRIYYEKFGSVMSNPAADLPANERILICRIVPYQQNSLRFVQLLHRQQRIGSVFAECRN